jgi:RNA polymerase-binding transcription factor
MDLKHFEEKLLAKQQECRDTLQKLQADARDTDLSEVRDSSDDAAVAEGVSEALEEGTAVSHILELVEEALARIKDGSYGNCLACEEEIAPARLEAIPWAQYCIKDQERLDEENNVPTGSTL